MTQPKRMTMLAAVGALALLVAGGAVAGHHGDGKKMHGDGKMLMADPARHAAKLAEMLSLTDAQTADEQVFAEARAERVAIGDRYTLNQRKEAHEEIKALHERTHARIAALLDEAQKAEFEAMQEKRRMRAEHRQEMRKMHREHKEAMRDDG